MRAYMTGNMSRFFSRMNPTVRGFLILAAIAGVIVVLQLEQTLIALLILARIAFILAIAYFIFLMWRERREGISTWSPRAQWCSTARRSSRWPTSASTGTAARVGYEILAFVGVLALCGFAMWRTWRDQHTYV